MTKTPKISIIIPVFNVENYLAKCLDSIINQTLMDIEIICVNDGSKDNSVDILNTYAQRDKRITIINKANGGLSSARNAGIRVANGEYICFLDSDDYFEFNACERLYIEILEGHADIIVFGANIFPLNPWPDYWLFDNLSPRTITYNSFVKEALFKEKGATPFVWRNCFKRKFLLKNKLLFNEDIKFGEDLIFQFCAFPQAKNITFISDKLYNYRWYREGSLMNLAGKDIQKKYLDHVNEIKIITDYWNKNNLINKYGKDLLKWSISFIYNDIKRQDIKIKLLVYRKLIEVWHQYNLLKFYKYLSPREKNCVDSILSYFSPKARYKKIVLYFPRLVKNIFV